jgi:hypothetical protein
MKWFKKESGFSLVQGLVIAAIVAGSSLVATRLLTDQKLAQKGAETRDQVEELHNLIYSVLQNRLNCKETMVGNTLQVALSASGTATATHALTRIRTKDADVVITGQRYMNENVELKSMTLLGQTGGQRNLQIVYERLRGAEGERTKSGYGAKEIRKTITLRIQRETTGTVGAFSSCYALSGGKSSQNATNSTETGNDITKQMCEEMNPTTGTKAFVWDEANSICRPNAQCPGNQIYTGIDSLGTVKCRNIEDWMDFNQVLDPTAPASCPNGAQVRFEIDNVSSKVRIVCSGGSAGCTAGTLSWTQSGNTCNASVGAGSVGGSVALSDSTLPTSGSGTASCSASGWTATGTCDTTCAAGSVSWTESGNTCTASVTSATSNQTRAASDTTTPTTGSGTATCQPNLGTWTTTGTCTTSGGTGYTYFQPSTSCDGGGTVSGTFTIPNSSCPGGSYRDRSGSCGVDECDWDLSCSGSTVTGVTRFRCKAR